MCETSKMNINTDYYSQQKLTDGAIKGYDKCRSCTETNVGRKAGNYVEGVETLYFIMCTYSLPSRRLVIFHP